MTMNIVQVLILLACIAVLVVNILTWRSLRKTAEMMRAPSVNIVNTTEVDFASVEDVRKMLRQSEASARRREAYRGAL